MTEQAQLDHNAQEIVQRQQMALNAWYAAKLVLAAGLKLQPEQLVLAIKGTSPQAQEALNKIPLEYLTELVDSFNTLPQPSNKELVEQEMSCRRELVDAFFPKPAEGTNTCELQGGWKLKYNHKLERKVDEAAVGSIKDRLREEFKVNPDPLFKIKHEVSIKEYRSLEKINKEAFAVLEECLTIKPGSPTVELIEPKQGI